MKESHLQQQTTLPTVKYTRGKDRHWNYELGMVKLYAHVSALILNAGKRLNGHGHKASLPIVSAFSLVFSKTKPN